MIVHMIFIGRLGNNMFQYFIGSMLSRAFECPLRISIYSGFSADGSLVLRSMRRAGPGGLVALRHRFKNVRLLPYEGFQGSRRQDILWRHDGWDGQHVDLGSIMSDGTDREIRMLGYFQAGSLYRGLVDEMRATFAYDEARGLPRISDGDVLVNVRGGADFERQGWVISPTYYVDRLNELTGIQQLYVCGLGIDQHIRRALAPWRPIYVRGGPIFHLSLMRRFRRIVLSNSTFAWWAGLLSDAETILAPEAIDSNSFSFKGNGVDLDIGDSRFVFRHCTFREASTHSPSFLGMSSRLWRLASLFGRS
jgi:hypothetical protein